MPTVKELADKLNVSPQTVRRYIKQEFNLQTEQRKQIVLSDEQASIVANHFADNAKLTQGKDDSGNEKPIVAEEQRRNVATQDVAHVADVAIQDQVNVEDVAEQAPRMTDSSAVTSSQNKMLQDTLQQLQQAKIDVATYKERVAGLERENALLREQLEQSNKALEREQMAARGFWNRLGQKLLPFRTNKE